MAYPTYDLSLIAPGKRLMKDGVAVDQISGINASHACMLKTAGTSVTVNIKKHSPGDPFPILEITFTDVP